MDFLLLLLLGAFEFPVPLGAGASLSAGAAMRDLGSGLVLNPALLVSCGKLQAIAACASPHGLDGVRWVGAGAGSRLGRLAVGGSVSRLSFGDYAETEAGIVLAAEPWARLGVGVGARYLGTSFPGALAAAPALDVGVVWTADAIRLGAAVRSLNMPELQVGQPLGPVLRAGAAWEPVDALSLAIDYTREPGIESAAAGVEFRLARVLAARVGVGFAPLHYSAGLVVGTGAVAAVYAFQYNPSLGATHVFGVEGCWR
jgi:hypothetical protein